MYLKRLEAEVSLALSQDPAFDKWSGSGNTSKDDINLKMRLYIDEFGKPQFEPFTITPS